MSRQFMRQSAAPGLIMERVRGILFDAGPTVPSNGAVGWAPGCIFIKDNGTIGDQVYINTGTAASAAFIVYENVNQIALSVTANITLTAAVHSNRALVLNNSAGLTVTLPAFSGSGAKFRFFVGTLAATGNYVVSATGAFIFGSLLQNNDTANGDGFQTTTITNASGSTTVTLDGTTLGGRKGDWFEIEDVGTNLGMIRGALNASGTEATPFS